MNYQDVIRDSKFYLPMNLNLGYLLKDTEIVILMNVINCDTIHEELSVRKLMRYTNRSNNTVQNALKTLRVLKLIEGFKPNYETLKYVFDKLNSAPSIEERKKWCELYQNSIQQSVSETGTVSVSKTGTQIKKIEKEDIYKKDLNISCNISKDEIEKKKEFETACGVDEEMETELDEVGISSDDFNWDDEIKRFKARVNKTKTKEELKGISIDFHKKMNDFNFPIELEDELDGIKKAVNSKMYSLSI